MVGGSGAEFGGNLAAGGGGDSGGGDRVLFGASGDNLSEAEQGAVGSASPDAGAPDRFSAAFRGGGAGFSGDFDGDGNGDGVFRRLDSGCFQKPGGGVLWGGDFSRFLESADTIAPV